MKQKKSGFATNKAGVIKPPKNPSTDSPKANAKRGNDLRAGKGSRGKD